MAHVRAGEVLELEGDVLGHVAGPGPVAQPGEEAAAAPEGAGVVLEARQRLDQGLDEARDPVARELLEHAEVHDLADHGLLCPVVRAAQDAGLEDAQGGLGAGFPRRVAARRDAGRAPGWAPRWARGRVRRPEASRPRPRPTGARFLDRLGGAGSACATGPSSTAWEPECTRWDRGRPFGVGSRPGVPAVTGGRGCGSCRQWRDESSSLADRRDRAAAGDGAPEEDRRGRRGGSHGRGRGRPPAGRGAGLGRRDHDAAGGYLLAREAEHSFLLGLAGAVRDRPDAFGDAYLAVVRDAVDVALVTAWTPDRRMVLSLATRPDAVDLVVADLLGRPARPPGVVGPVDAARRFVATWEAGGGPAARLEMRTRTYRLDALVPPARPAEGFARAAAGDDVAIVAAWLIAFEAEALPQQASRTTRPRTSSRAGSRTRGGSSGSGRRAAGRCRWRSRETAPPTGGASASSTRPRSTGGAGTRGPWWRPPARRSSTPAGRSASSTPTSPTRPRTTSTRRSGTGRSIDGESYGFATG